jgi:hypothetical protein
MVSTLYSSSAQRLTADRPPMISLHWHESIRLRLNHRNAGDGLELLEERLFGSKFGAFPFTEGPGIQCGHNLEVHAAAADNALHTLDALDCLHLR